MEAQGHGTYFTVRERLASRWGRNEWRYQQHEGFKHATIVVRTV